MAEWINVKDRLPELGTPVLVGSQCWDYGVVANYAGKGVWLDTWHQCVTRTPTHWMPQPEMPKKDGEMSEWLSIKDGKLPELETPVLVGSPHWDYGVVVHYTDEGVWMGTQHQRITRTPTHWMPMPEMPKEDSNNG